MLNFKELKLNDKIIFAGTEFDGTFRYEGIVTEVADTYVIATADGMGLLIDEDTKHLFAKA